MFDLNDVSSGWYDSEHQHRLPLGGSSSRRYRRPVPLWREHYEYLQAEADESDLLRRLPPGESWQRRLYSHVGRWLVALGHRLENRSDCQTRVAQLGLDRYEK